MEINTVPSERILLARIMIFESCIDGFLTMKELPDSEAYRKVIFMEGKLIDFATGDELMHINTDENGIVYPEIYVNTMYIDEIFNYNHLTDEEYDYAQELYAYHKKREKLIKEKKLLLFKQRRIY